MERFDPSTALTVPALFSSRWMPGESASSGNGFGERPIGELVRAIVARLGQQDGVAEPGN